MGKKFLSEVTVEGTSTTGVLGVLSKAANALGGYIRGFTGQTRNLFEFQNSAGTPLTAVAANGTVTVPPTTTAAAAAGLRVGTVDSTGLVSVQGLDFSSITYGMVSTNRTFGVGGWTGNGWHLTRPGAALQLVDDAFVLYQFPASSVTPGNPVFIVDTDKNVGVSTQQFGSGEGVIGVLDAVVAPTTTPIGGGVLYSVGGEAKWKGSNGRVSPLSTIHESTFTPAVVGWHRIVTGTNWGGGVLTISAPLYDATLTDIELHWQISGYGIGGHMQLVRWSPYNNGVVYGARISSDGVANVYLDIYISSATAPQPITLRGSGYAHPAFHASPASGVAAGASSEKVLVFGTGFRSTAQAVLVGADLGGAKAVNAANGTAATDLVTKAQLDAVDQTGLYVQGSAPVGPPSSYLWVQTGLGDDGSDVTFWIEDGS